MKIWKSFWSDSSCFLCWWFRSRFRRTRKIAAVAEVTRIETIITVMSVVTERTEMSTVTATAATIAALTERKITSTNVRVFIGGIAIWLISVRQPAAARWSARYSAANAARYTERQSAQAAVRFTHTFWTKNSADMFVAKITDQNIKESRDVIIIAAFSFDWLSVNYCFSLHTL